MTNCTVSENGSVDLEPLPTGGTIFNSGVATLTNCTVTKNVAGASNAALGPATGIMSGTAGGSSLSLVRTIVSGDFFLTGFRGVYGSEIGDLAINALPNVTADRSIFGHAGVGDEEASGEVRDADPKWLPDADNLVATSDGANIPLEQILDTTLRLNAPGETATHALPKGSPAIDFGLDCAALATDQRGSPRPIDGDGDGDGTVGSDVGAYEFACGNGIIDASAGEACDDGNDDEGDGCAFCRVVAPTIGDGGDDDESGGKSDPDPRADDDEGPPAAP